MMLHQDWCIHPREQEQILSKEGHIERVRCKLCGREWMRYEDAQGEDV
jgi:hypothetical protein